MSTLLSVMEYHSQLLVSYRRASKESSIKHLQLLTPAIETYSLYGPLEDFQVFMAILLSSPSMTCNAHDCIT